MNELIFQILTTLVYVLFAAIARYAIPWLMSKVKSTKYELLSVIVEDAVRAFEQTITGEGEGARRKDLVTEYVMKACEKYNIPIDAEQLNVLIEKAVQGMNSEKLLVGAE